MRGRPQRNWGALAPLCLLLFLFFLLTLGASYKPVVVVHGLFDSPSEFSQLLCFINQSHPGTNVTVVDLFDHSQSLKPLWVQVEGFRRAISPIMQNAADGVHLICYSQGTAGPRALVPPAEAGSRGCRSGMRGTGGGGGGRRVGLAGGCGSGVRGTGRAGGGRAGLAGGTLPGPYQPPWDPAPPDPP
uniref:Palmitoyl-protein thioesterase 2 n=1 Tax=Chelonoidis abingdonii TaxID=106734 RepID=A0A8C0J2X6_CHEAB